MKCFPKLTQTHVRIEVAGGDSISVPMLPVKALDEFRGIEADLKTARRKLKDSAKGEDADIFETYNKTMAPVKERLVALVSEVMPEEYRANLARFDIPRLLELAGYLMFGDDDDQPKKDGKGGAGTDTAEKKSC